MNATLYIETNKLVLQWGGRVAEIPLSIADLEAQFTPYPSSEITWGSSIMQVEDAISPYRDALVDYHVLELYNAASLRTLSDEIGQISIELIECAFAVLAGYRPSRDLPKLSYNATTAAFVLLLREWGHHLDFDLIQLMD